MRPVLEDGAVLGAQVEEKTVTNAAQPPAIVSPVTPSTAQNSSPATAHKSSDVVLTNNNEARLIG